MKGIFLDLETTGLDFDTHVVLDVGIAVVDFNNMHTMMSYTSCITCDAHDWTLADKKALEVNGFTPENHWQLAKKDYVVRDEIIDFFKLTGVQKEKSFFICQNPSFDRPFFLQIMSQELMNDLNLPYHWLDLASMFWLKKYACINPSPEQISLSKDSIAQEFLIPPEKKPHKALNGVMHLIRCYKALVNDSVRY